MAAKRSSQGIPNKAVFQFEKDQDYRLVAVDGAWGGVTNKGEIAMHLYSEQHALPTSITHVVEPEGRIGAQIDPQPGQLKYVRHLSVGVVMRPENARSIATWLLGKVDEYENLQRQRLEEEKKGTLQ